MMLLFIKIISRVTVALLARTTWITDLAALLTLRTLTNGKEECSETLMYQAIFANTVASQDLPSDQSKIMQLLRLRAGALR